MPQAKPTPLPADYVRDISERVYRLRLGPKDVACMLAEDNDDGKKLRERAAAYDYLTRAYLTVMSGRDIESF